LPPNVQKKCRDILSFQEIWPENRRIIGHNLLYAEDPPFPCLLSLAAKFGFEAFHAEMLTTLPSIFAV